MKLKHRIIYDDDGNPLREGAKVLVNDRHVGILHFDDEGEITITGDGIYMEDVETVEAISDDRFEELEDTVLEDR